MNPSEIVIDALQSPPMVNPPARTPESALDPLVVQIGCGLARTICESCAATFGISFDQACGGFLNAMRPFQFDQWSDALATPEDWKMIGKLIAFEAGIVDSPSLRITIN
ncbi:MAG: hypothetical protein K2X76_10725 [Sphingomonas sp.]|nr:hypothetical protein [Sphingomonas sp.]